MRIGYGKIGRSWNLDVGRASTIGGDIDVIRLLRYLAGKYPQHEFFLIGRNSGEVPQQVGYPENVTNPWTEWRQKWWMPTSPLEADKVYENFHEMAGNVHETIDAFVVWAGHHGSANSRIPQIGTDYDVLPTGCGGITGGSGPKFANPYFNFMNYVSWFLDLISRWRELNITDHNREEIWLIPDPRNHLKCRELRWPLRKPILAQFNMVREQKHERYGKFEMYDFAGVREHTIWKADNTYEYSGIELTALPAPSEIVFDPRPGSIPFGLIMNENADEVKNNRLDVLNRWVFPYTDDVAIFGNWTQKSQQKMGKTISPVPYTDVHRVAKFFRTTLTTPASGSGWATSKPWEAFAIGNICFFHPNYDTQGHILPILTGAPNYGDKAQVLSDFLRVKTPTELWWKIRQVNENDSLYDEYATLQRQYFEESWQKYNGGARRVEERLGLIT